MLFLIFRFPENRPLECCFPENRPLEWKTDHMTCFPLIKCSEKNKMDNSQNGYSSVEKTGKIKKKAIVTIRGSYMLRRQSWGNTPAI